MKNIISIKLILAFVMTSLQISLAHSGCNVNLPENMPVITLLSTTSYGDLDIQNKNVIIGSPTDNNISFYGNTKFTNCRITLYKKFGYTDKKYEFYNCEINLQPLSAFRSFNGFNASNSELIFEGNCINGYNTSEMLHVQNSSLRFVNNFVSVGSYGHLFHIVGSTGSGDNSFYGNTITNTYDEPNQGIISIDQLQQEIKIGDNSQAKNIFTNTFGHIIYEQWMVNNKVKVENSEFSTFETAINLGVHCKTLEINNCIFKNSPISVHFKGDDLFIENCTFTNNNIGIKVSKSSKNGVGDIKNNSFSSNTIDIFTTGAFNQLEVFGNNFSGREFGFLADGHNFYDLKNNSFYNSYAGNIAYANGSNNNFVQGNRYYTLIGTHALEVNSLFQFNDNCFSTAGGDVYLDGSVSTVIGSQSAEANNCFTKGGVPDLTAATNPFVYYRSDNSPNCEDPVTSGSYTDYNADIKDVLNCGSGTPFTSTVRKYCNINFKHTTCKQAKDMLVAIDKDITDVNMSTTYIEMVKTNILNVLKNCRMKLLAFLKTCINPLPNDPRFPDSEVSSSPWTGNEPQQASIALKTSSNKYERAEYISTMISMGNFSEVNQYLQSYSAEDDEDADFNEVQKINVARLLSPEEYAATADDLNELQQAANKPYPLAAYARGLYTQLTGDIIMPPIPRLTFNRTITKNNSYFTLMPNPMTDQFQVAVPHLQTYEIRISDITGKTYYQNDMLESVTDINTTGWPTGVYFVVCTNVQGVNECKKLIKQ